MKRFLLTLLCFSALFLLASCGGGTNPPAVTDPTVTDPAVTDPSSFELSLDRETLAKYTLVCTEEDQMYAWEGLRSALQKATGVRLSISETALNEGYAITFEDSYDAKGIYTYGRRVEGKTVILYGARTEGIWYNIDPLVDALAQIQNGAVVLTDAEMTAEELRIEGKEYALDQFFDAAGKLYPNVDLKANVVFGDGPIASEKDADDLVVVFLGCSHTEGGWSFMQEVCEYLSSYFGRRVVYYNAGVGGTTSSTTAARTAALARYAPDIVVLDENYNDLGNGNNTKQYVYNESILLQMQSWAKVPVVIMNEIPRVDAPDSALLQKNEKMLDYKRELMDYYGIDYTPAYDYMVMQWQEIQASFDELGWESPYVRQFSAYFTGSPWNQYAYFSKDGEAYQKLQSDTPSMDFLTYLACYSNAKSGTTDTFVNYDIHPHDSGYALIGKAMVYFMEQDMVSYLSNAIKPADYTLLHADSSDASAVYNMIGADGTAYLADGTVSTRDITYKVGDTVYAFADRLTDNDFLNEKSQWSFWTGKVEEAADGTKVNNWYIPSSFDTAIWNQERHQNYIGKGTYFNTKPYTAANTAALRPNLTSDQITKLNKLTETINHHGGYMANGVAQMYFNASDRANGAAAPEASFTFTSSADSFAVYILTSGFMGATSVEIKNTEGQTVKTYTNVLKYESSYTTPYGRITDWVTLPGDGKEYTVTVTVQAPTEGKYLYRFGYILERINAN